MKKRFLTFLGLAVLTVSTIAQSGGGSTGATDPVSTALGKTYVAGSRGVYTLGANPANLMFMKNNEFEFTLPSLSINAGFNFMTINDYNYFFGGTGEVDANGKKVGRYFTDDDKARFKDLFKDGGLISVEANVTSLSFVYKPSDVVGAFGFAITDHIASVSSLPSTIVDLAIDGNKSNTTYNFDQAKTTSWWLRQYSLTYARDLNFIKPKEIKSLYAGISFNIVKGFAYAGLDYIHTSLTTQADNTITGVGDMALYTSMSPDFGMSYDFDSTTKSRKQDIKPLTTPAGSGFSVDLGFASEIQDGLVVALSFRNLGSIKWEKETVRYGANSAIFLDDLLDQAQRDSLVDNIKGKGEYTGSFVTPLARAMGIGVQVQVDKFVKTSFPGKLLVSADYNQGFNNMPGNSVIARWSFGANWRWVERWYCPSVMTGLSFGGGESTGWAFGLGADFGPVQMYLSTSKFNSAVAPAKAKMVSVAMGWKWNF